MNYKEAHEALENKHRCNQRIQWCGGRCCECECATEITKEDEAICVAIEALEKHIQKNSVDYTIISKPVKIGFECPHCLCENERPFKEEYWEGYIQDKCDYCGRKVKLEGWKYD